MQKKLFILFITFLMFHLVAEAQNNTFVNQLNKTVPDLLKKNNASGLSVGLIEKGQVVFTGGYGLADIDSKRPMQGDTIINVASVSKPITVWGAIRLAENYKINLDAPVETFLHRWKFPPTRFDKNGVTLRRLLNHTAGISLMSVPWFPDNSKIPTLEQVLKGEAGENKPVIIEKEPGKIWSYSGGGYTIIELLIEEVSRKSFDEYMQKEIFRPLKMKDTNYLTAKDLSRLAVGYDENGKPVPHYRYVGESAAGLNTTVKDFAKLLQAYVKDSGRKIINSANFKQIYESTVKVELDGVKDEKYGLGHGVYQTKSGDTILYHSGGNPGVRAYFLISLKSGNGMVLVSNSDNGASVIVELVQKWSEFYKTDVQQVY